MTNKIYIVDLAQLLDTKLMLEFPKEMYFDGKALGDESTRDISLIRLLKSPAFIAWSLEKKSFPKPTETKIEFLSSNPNELFDG